MLRFHPSDPHRPDEAPYQEKEKRQEGIERGPGENYSSQKKKGTISVVLRNGRHKREKDEGRSYTRYRNPNYGSNT